LDIHDDELLTTEQLATRLKVGAFTVRKWGRIGLIPEVRFGRKVRRYSLSAVISALSTREVVAEGGGA